MDNLLKEVCESSGAQQKTWDVHRLARQENSPLLPKPEGGGEELTVPGPSKLQPLLPTIIAWPCFTCMWLNLRETKSSSDEALSRQLPQFTAQGTEIV